MRFIWRGVAALALPLVLESAYLFLSRRPLYRFTAASDYTALTLAVGTGAVLIATLPLGRRARLAWLLIYMPLAVVLLVLYAFWFVGIAYDVWP